MSIKIYKYLSSIKKLQKRADSYIRKYITYLLIMCGSITNIYRIQIKSNNIYDEYISILSIFMYNSSIVSLSLIIIF